MNLGLTYLSQKPMIDPKVAERTRIQYKSLTESFAIFPLAQGIMARIVVDDTQHGAANAMIFAGLGLTVGSHFLGKILYKRKKQYIEDENLRRQIDNAQVDENNAQVNQTVNDENTARNKAWVRKNRNTGKVEIESIESTP